MAIKKNFYLLLYSFILILKLDLYIFFVFDRDDIAQQLPLIIMNYQLSILVIRLKSTTVSNDVFYITRKSNKNHMFVE